MKEFTVTIQALCFIKCELSAQLTDTFFLSPNIHEYKYLHTISPMTFQFLFIPHYLFSLYRASLCIYIFLNCSIKYIFTINITSNIGLTMRCASKIMSILSHPEQKTPISCRFFVSLCIIILNYKRIIYQCIRHLADYSNILQTFISAHKFTLFFGKHILNFAPSIQLCLFNLLINDLCVS